MALHAKLASILKLKSTAKITNPDVHTLLNKKIKSHASLNYRQNLFCTKKPNIYFRKDPVLWGYLLRTDQCVCATFTFASGKQQPARVRSFVVHMTEQVTPKEDGSFSCRIPLTAWGPPALCRYRHQTTARCGRLYKVAYPISSRLSPPAYGTKPQPKVATLLTTRDLLCSRGSTTDQHSTKGQS